MYFTTLLRNALFFVPFLPSNTPSEPLASARGLPISTHRADGRAPAASGDDHNTMWQILRLMTDTIHHSYMVSGKSGRDFEAQLHEAWHHVYLGASQISESSPGQERLLFHMLQLQGRGPLVRRRAPAPDVDQQQAQRVEWGQQQQQPLIEEIALTSSDGALWTDLPFFASDMQTLWRTHAASMSAVRRRNFAAFLAKAASVGLAHDRLAGISLSIVRDALEVSRPLGRSRRRGESGGESDGIHGQDGGDGGGDQEKSLDELTVAELLPLVSVWISQMGWKFVDFVHTEWNDCSEDLSRFGDLLEAELGPGFEQGGFSAARWDFWYRRLRLIAIEARDAHDDALAASARWIMGYMKGSLHMTGLPTLEEATLDIDMAPKSRAIKFDLAQQLVREGLNTPGMVICYNEKASADDPFGGLVLRREDELPF